MKILGLTSWYVSFSFKSPFELCLVASRRAIDGVIRPKLGQLLGMFDFPEKVKAWCDDVVSRAGRSYLPISK